MGGMAGVTNFVRLSIGYGEGVPLILSTGRDTRLEVFLARGPELGIVASAIEAISGEEGVEEVSTTFALVEDGTSRVMLFLPGKVRCVRSIAGVWTDAWGSPSEVVMPDELGDFRAASTSELSALLQEAAASSTLSPDLASAALNAAS
jgi:hypothetical protein